MRVGAITGAGLLGELLREMDSELSRAARRCSEQLMRNESERRAHVQDVEATVDGRPVEAELLGPEVHPRVDGVIYDSGVFHDPLGVVQLFDDPVVFAGFADVARRYDLREKCPEPLPYQRGDKPRDWEQRQYRKAGGKRRRR